MSHSTARTDVYQNLTNLIIAAIERVSADEFRLPWHRTGLPSIRPINATTNAAYRGINVV